MKPEQERILVYPTLWPLWLRRTFILTLPISVIVWFAAIFISFIAACVYLSCVQVYPWFSAMWGSTCANETQPEPEADHD